MTKHNEILSQLRDLEIQLKTASANVNKSPFEQHKDDGDDDEDALDVFMMKLSAPKFDKKLVSRIKVNIMIKVKLQYVYMSLWKQRLQFKHEFRHKVFTVGQVQFSD